MASHFDTLCREETAKYCTQKQNDLHDIAQKEQMARRDRESSSVQLASIIEKLDKHDARLNMAETHCSISFYALFRGGKSQDIAREKSKVALYNNQREQIKAKISEATVAVVNLEEDRAIIQNQLADIEQVTSLAMADVLDNTIREKRLCPTDNWKRLRQMETNITYEMEQNRQLRSTAQYISQHLESALHNFDLAYRWQRGAARSNRIGMATAVAAPLHTTGTGSQRLRTSRMNVAMAKARLGCHDMQLAFHAITPLLMERNPGLGQRLSTAIFPELQNQKFARADTMDVVFGQIGAIFNDAQCGTRIQENMGLLNQCIQYVRDHLQAVANFQKAILERNLKLELEVLRPLRIDLHHERLLICSNRF